MCLLASLVVLGWSIREISGHPYLKRDSGPGVTARREKNSSRFLTNPGLPQSRVMLLGASPREESVHIHRRVSRHSCDGRRVSHFPSVCVRVYG